MKNFKGVEIIYDVDEAVKPSFMYILPVENDTCELYIVDDNGIRSKIKNNDFKSYTISLTNSISTVPAKNNGEVIGIIPSTQAIVYIGDKIDTGWNFLAMFFGCTGVIDPNIGNVEVHSMSQDSAKVEITAVKEGVSPLIVTYVLTKVKSGSNGENGNDGVGIFKSTSFIRSISVPERPQGGNWANPLPTTDQWSDGVPSGDLPLYMSTRIFTINGLPPQQQYWTEPNLVSDTPDIDFEFSSVLVDPGTPTLTPDNWYNEAKEDSVWIAIRTKTNGIWSSWGISKIKGEDGSNGLDGTDGTNGSNGDGYEFEYNITEKGANPPDLNGGGWSSIYPATISNTQTLWIRHRVKYGNGTFGEWKGPAKLTGDDGTSIQGPAMAFRGDWSGLKQYSGSKFIVDVVKYTVNGKGYIAKPEAGLIPIGTLPTNSQYWNAFESNIDSLFSDFIFSWSGYIQNLTVGQIQTDTQGERTTIGFKPLDDSDPTKVYSNHSPRGYYPSGRINWILTYIPSNNPIYLPDGKVISDAGALVFYKDQPGSPIHSVLDSESNEVIFNMPESWRTDNLLPIHGITTPQQPLSEFQAVIATNYATSWTTPNGINRYLYSKGNDSQSKLNEPFEGYHTTEFKSFLNFIPNGWYTYGNHPMTAGRPEPGSDSYRKGVLCFRIWNGQVNARQLYYDPNYIFIDWFG